MSFSRSNEFAPPSSLPSQAQVRSFMPMPAYMSCNNKDEEHARSMEAVQQIVQMFWEKQMADIQNISGSSAHPLPLSRMRKIMTSNEQVKVVRANTPVLFSKACELFVMELTLRAWLNTQADERKTLQRCDIVRAIRQDNIHLQFLDEVVPLNGDKEEASRKHPEYICNGQMQLPLMAMNQASLMPKINGIPQDFMIPPSISSTGAMFGFGSKVNY